MVGRSEPLQRNCSAQLVGRVESRREGVAEVLLESGGLCVKRENQVLACGRGRCLVWVDGREQCHVGLVCVAMKGSMRESHSLS